VHSAPPFVDFDETALSAKGAKAGKKGSITLTILNARNTTASATRSIQFAVSTSADGSNPTVAGTVPGHLKILPNKKQTIHFSPVIPAALPPGSYYLIATLTSPLTESTLANNTLVSAKPFVVS
jgi:hypothetical protein